MQIATIRDHAALSAIHSWKHWNDIQIGAQKEYGMPKEQFDVLLPEYQKFLGLIALGYTGLGMFSPEIDKIWHAHILNTLLYEKFCMQVFGRLIHHIPNLSGQGAVCTDPEKICTDQECGSCDTGEHEAQCIGSDDEDDEDDKKSMSALDRFRNAYLTAYGQLPGEVWNLPEPHGSAIVV